jgi:hypothetical protein
MTSFQQLEANRRNATRSTGPITEAGKHRSRRNAVRHGLCSETVIGILEDIEDYRGFEAAIIADYDAETAVERELVLRLASLLWRIRRATSIETSLLRTQAEILRDRERLIGQARDPVYEILGANVPNPCERSEACPRDCDPKSADLNPGDHPFRPATSLDPARDLSVCFQRLANFDSAAFERLGRYESALARQIVQVIFLLNSTRRRRLSRRP